MPTPESDLSEALEAVLQRYQSTVRRLARERGLQEHEVDEVFQEVRIRLWKALEDPERIATVKASYVHRATLSAALDLIRRRRDREHPLQALESVATGSLPADRGAAAAIRSPEGEFVRSQLREKMATALAALPERRRVPVRMHLSGFGLLEIAGVLGWTEPTARNLLYRGLADLRKELLRLGVGPPGQERSTG
jgi:RNA polymerase sigma factor (sigma-70 family)